MTTVEFIQYQWVQPDGVILATETVQWGVRIAYAEVSPPPDLTAPEVRKQYRYPPSPTWIDVRTNSIQPARVTISVLRAGR